VQDYGYDYDLVGNLLSLHDRTPGSGVSPTPDRLDRAFTYDPLYQLTSATGRECDVPPPAPWSDAPRCTDLTKVRPYTEQYTYDEAGGLLRLAHHWGTGRYARNYHVPAAADQLSAMIAGATSYSYTFDSRGNTLSETTSRHFEWNHAGYLATFRTQAASAGPSLFAEYRYDITGQRVLKIVRKQGGHLAVTTYIGGLFERLTLTSVNGNTQHDTLHVLDGTSRVATARAGPPAPADRSPPVAYHLGDHLGSSTVVLDGSGGLVNREEYTPFGETSFGSFARKRYRYTAKERDEESGLYYHGVRYYAPWLCRWVTCDPQGPATGSTLYAYVRNNPLRFVDQTGRQGTVPDLTGTAAATTGPGQGASGGDVPMPGPGASDTAWQEWESAQHLMPQEITVTGWSDEGRALFNGKDFPRTVAADLAVGAPTPWSGPRTTTDLDRLALGIGAVEFAPLILWMGIGAYGAAMETYVALNTSARLVLARVSLGNTPFFRVARALLAIVGIAASHEPEVTTEAAEEAADEAAEMVNISPTVGELRKAGAPDAHHVVMDAAVRDVPGYNTNAAPGIQLEGPSTEIGTEHYLATQVQRTAGIGGTYGAERQVAAMALTAAGLSPEEVADALKRADSYFMDELGLTLDSYLRVPGNRKMP
jgi:RHS repeat-associated protein